MEIRNLNSMSVSEIKHYVDELKPQMQFEVVQKLLTDKRAGVKKIGELLMHKQEAAEKEKQRLTQMMKFENELYAQGLNYIAGIDEAGRGPLAGPVSAAAIILPKDCYINGINDSKKLSPKRRDKLYDEIIDKAIAYNVSIISNEVIDSINILNATKVAMKSALEALEVIPEFVLVDAVNIPDIQIRQNGIIKGDALSVSIAAASILAKVTRDRIMLDYDKIYPQYGFALHKGYGTQEHIEAIREFGPCPIHRRSFLRNI